MIPGVNEQRARRNLAEAVKERRETRGWRQADVAERGGVSLERVQAIEGQRANLSGMHPRTKTTLERGLRWRPGSVDLVLVGEAPETIEAYEQERRAVRDHRNRVAHGLTRVPPTEAARALLADMIDEGIEDLPRVRAKYGRAAAVEAMRHLLEMDEQSRMTHEIDEERRDSPSSA